MPEKRKTARTGRLLTDQGLISTKDLVRALAIQKNRLFPGQNRRPLLGHILCDLGLITPMDTYCALEEKGKLLSLQDVLIQKKIAPPSRVKAFEARAARQGIPLISLLLDGHILPQDQLAQLLFDLFHIPLKSRDTLSFNKADQGILTRIVSQEQADRKGVIPLAVRDKTIRVGIIDPAGLKALKQMDRRFPHYRFCAVFIPFSGFTEFQKRLYKKNRRDPHAGRPLAPTIRVTDPADQRAIVLDLYRAYEQALAKEPGSRASVTQDRSDLFFAFISDYHAKMARQYQCPGIRFSLARQNGRVQITAMPENKEKPSWQGF